MGRKAKEDDEFVYVYSFMILPPAKVTSSTKDLLQKLINNSKVEMYFTDTAFRKFEADLKSDGFILGEIERWSVPKPEKVWRLQ